MRRTVLFALTLILAACSTYSGERQAELEQRSVRVSTSLDRAYETVARDPDAIKREQKLMTLAALSHKLNGVQQSLRAAGANLDVGGLDRAETQLGELETALGIGPPREPR